MASIGIGFGIENPRFPSIGIGIGIDFLSIESIGIGIGIDFGPVRGIGIGIGLAKLVLSVSGPPPSDEQNCYSHMSILY